MKYLLDVNALLAFGIFHHVFHTRATAWTGRLHGSELLTCSITELGFVRVAAQATAYGFTVAQAQTVLSSLKTQNKPQFKFISDAVEIARLPSWVKTPNQTTDGHLLQLAKASGAALATFDRGIPGAFLIP